MFFSNTERTFFDDEVNPALPADAKVISSLDHAVIFAGVAAGKGIDFSGARPALIDLPSPPVEQFREMALSERDRGLSVAALRIAPLQDAVDLDDASEADLAELKKWKQYRVALNRIELQAGFPTNIDWPVLPS